MLFVELYSEQCGKMKGEKNINTATFASLRRYFDEKSTTYC